jgi:hypothetical protein
MGEAIGQTLPLAVAVALSPIPIIAIVLMLVTRRARSNGLAFLLGWTLGLALVGAVVLVVVGGAGASDDGEPTTWVSLLKLLLGILILLVAVRSWLGRPRQGDDAPLASWLGALDAFTAPKALGAGAALAGPNPLNLLLTIAAATAIAEAGLPAGDEALAYTVFTLIATVGVATPVVIHFSLGAGARPVLDRVKGWMAAHNAAIMSVLCLLIGAKLVGDAITALA